MAFFIIAAGWAPTVRGEEFAQPPQWTEEVLGVFFEDARKELKGEPPTQTSADSPENRSAQAEPSAQAIWRELVTPETLSSTVRGTLNRLARDLRSPSYFKGQGHWECRRQMTLLAVVFRVISEHPADIRWKSLAQAWEQSCLLAADACQQGDEKSLATLREVLTALDGLLTGQPPENLPQPTEELHPEFTPLMQQMKEMVDDTLPMLLGKPHEFRRKSEYAVREAQLLAMLSQVIRGEEYGYADDETYQRHADKLRDAAKQLSEAATAEEFEKAVQAAAAIQKSCNDCHADFRG